MSRFVSGEGGCGAAERVLRLRGGRAARIAGPPHTTIVRRCLRCRTGIYATEVRAATAPLRATARAVMSAVLDVSGVVRRAKMVGRLHAMCARLCRLYLTCQGLCGAGREDGRRLHAMCARLCRLYLTCQGLCGAGGEDGGASACDGGADPVAVPVPDMGRIGTMRGLA